MTKRIPAQCFHPGEFIRDEITERGWTVEELVRRMSHPKRMFTTNYIQRIMDEKESVTPFVALGLSRAFGTSVELWINLQSSFNEWRKVVKETK
jgi:addiction module HigA family antidote